MTSVYEKNVAYRQAVAAMLTQQKELQDLEEMKECTFKPRINKSFSAKSRPPKYEMDAPVRMPARLRHLQVPCHRTHQFEKARKSKEPKSLDSVLPGVTEAFEQLDMDLNKRHFVIQALEKENRRLRLEAVFAHHDVPSAQQHFGGDYKVTHERLLDARSRTATNDVCNDLKVEADGLFGGLSDYLRHSTSYISNLLWEFDQVSRANTDVALSRHVSVPPWQCFRAV